MKHIRYKILLIAFVVSLTTKAQVKFSPSIIAEYGFGETEKVENYYGVNFIAGIDVGKRWNVGLGVGYEISNELYSRYYTNVHINYGKVHSYDYYDEVFVGEIQRIPVFVRGKYRFLESKFSPYISLDLGAAITVSGYGDENTLLIVRPAFGVDFSLGRGSLFLQLGYRNLKYEYEYSELTNKTNFKTQESGNCGMIELSAGYEF